MHAWRTSIGREYYFDSVPRDQLSWGQLPSNQFHEINSHKSGSTVCEINYIVLPSRYTGNTGSHSSSRMTPVEVHGMTPCNYCIRNYLKSISYIMCMNRCAIIGILCIGMVLFPAPLTPFSILSWYSSLFHHTLQWLSKYPVEYQSFH